MNDLSPIIWLAAVVWGMWIFIEIAVLKPLSYMIFTVLNFIYNFIIHFLMMLFISDKVRTSIMMIKDGTLYALLTTSVSLWVFYITVKTYHSQKLKK